MRNGTRTLNATIVGAAVAGLLLSGCGSSGKTDAVSADGTVKISIGGLPDNTKPEERKAFIAETTAFQKANPKIKLEASELLWDQQTFSAQLAGGTLPTLMDVPYGEMKGLIERKQVKDLTAQVKKSETLSSINDSLMKTGKNASGNIYGVPVAAYSIGLVINRDLFKKAGLNPDQPLTSWVQMAQAAQQITEKTGKKGFEHPSTEGYGGWLLGAMINGFGGNVLSENGGKYAANLDSDAAHQSLQFIKDLRWKAKAMGTNALPSSNDVNNDFAAGEVGMIITGADAYQNFTVKMKFPKANYGTLPLPQDTDGLGTSGGGRIAILRPDATDQQVSAAMKWIEWHFFNKYANKDAALVAAKAAAADGLPVPSVGLPLITQKRWDTYMGWIAPQVNVPMANLKPYMDSSATMPIVDEPMVAGQDLFAALDVPIQAVLSRQNADIDALLKAAQVVGSKATEAAQK